MSGEISEEISLKESNGNCSTEMIIIDGSNENDELKLQITDDQELKLSNTNDEATVLAGDEGNSKVVVKKMRRNLDVRCLFIGMMVSLLLVGTAAIAIVAHKFQADVSFEFRFANHFGDNMVLQRSPQKAVIWGFASFMPDNVTVTLELNSVTVNLVYRTTLMNTDAGVIWVVKLDERVETTPFKITIFTDQSSTRIELHHVLFGDVWACVGDDLLQVPVSELFNSSDKIYNAEVESSRLRLISVNPSQSDITWFNFKNLKHVWSIPTRDIISEASAICWSFAKELTLRSNHNVGLILTPRSSSHIRDWLPSNVAEKCQVDNGFNNFKAGKIWNSMIHPLLQISVHGVVWYQGERDAIENPYSYNCSLVEFLKNWRNESKRHLGVSTGEDPLFAIIQLAPLNTSHSSYGHADLRWKQTANYGYLPNRIIPNSFLIPSIDLPFVYSYHKRSTRHKVIAERLLAKVTSGGDDDGPFVPIKYLIDSTNQSMLLSFQSPIVVRSKLGFEVCCSKNHSLGCSSSFVKVSYAPGREWVETPIIKNDESDVILSTEKCHHHVVGLRYLWGESPCEFKSCPVYDSGSDLPMSPMIRVDLVGDGHVHRFSDSQVHLI